MFLQKYILFFIISIFTLSAVSCFEGLGPLGEDDYSDNLAQSLTVSVDHDVDEGELSLDITVGKAKDESIVGYYSLYWGDSEKNILETQSSPIKSFVPAGIDHSYEMPENTSVPSDARYVLLYTKLTEENLSILSGSKEIEDLVMKQVADINTGGDSSPESFVVYAGRLYFSAYDGAGRDLLCYDDAVGLQNISSSDSSDISNVNNLCAFNDRIYFSARNDSTGNELYCYNGTSVNIVSDYITGSDSLYPSELTVCGSRLFFRASVFSSSGDQLCFIDASHNYTEITVNGTKSASPENFFAYGDSLIFTANRSESASYEYKLMVYDGTLHEIDFFGASNPRPNYYTLFNGKVYFSADDEGEYGEELYCFDGTSVSLVWDIYPGLTDSLCWGLFVYNDKIYFSADNGAGAGRELRYWSEEGSGYFDLVEGSSGSYPQKGMTEYNGYLFFSAYTSSSNYELWVYRGSGVPEMITDLNPGSSGDSVDEFAVYNGRLYFAADDGTSGKELWVLYFK